MLYYKHLVQSQVKLYSASTLLQSLEGFFLNRKMNELLSELL